MRLLLLGTVLLGLPIAGCECGDSCEGVSCGPCPPALTLEIVVPGGAVPMVTGSPSLSCETAVSMTLCTGDAEPGSYTYEIAAEGRAPRSVTLTVGAGTSGCCACDVEGDYERVSFEILDAGPTDAGLDADVTPDAGTGRAERVEFPMGGTLAPGTLCDDVFVCVPDEDAAAAVTAASPEFDCTVGPGDPCTGGVRCAYAAQPDEPLLDAADVDAICAVTILEPPPDTILCRVYVE
jgi:hypothetical protein